VDVDGPVTVDVPAPVPDVDPDADPDVDPDVDPDADRAEPVGPAGAATTASPATDEAPVEVR
jgi:hypothetical protein